MSHQEQKSRLVARRGLLKGTAVTAAAGAAAMLGANAQAAGPETALGGSCVCPLPGVPKSWDYEADVVVVGYGTGGSAAAITAYDAGASVIVLEKMSVGGQSCAWSGGIVYGSGTYLQEEEGIEDSPDLMFDYYTAVGGGLSNPEILRVLSDRSGDTIKWLADMGVPFFMVAKTGQEDRMDSITPSIPRGHFTQGLGKELWAAVEKAVTSRDIEIMFNTKAVELVAGAEKTVLGVKAEQDGKTIYVRAKKGVVMTTGSYSWNQKLIGTFLPRYYGSWSQMPPGLDGDGLIMCQRLGVDLAGVGIPVASTPGILSADMPAPSGDVFSWSTMVAPLGGAPFIMVNKNGERFTNERANYLFIVDVLLDQPDKVSWAIFDENGRVHDTVPGLTYVKSGWEAELEAGLLKKADTIEELAELVGIDPEGLVATIEAWNATAEAGEVPEFGERDYVEAIVEPPFYAAEVRTTISDPICGVVINAQAQVIDVDGNVIPRLYAAGSLTGGWIGEMYPGSGSFLANAFNFGRVAAENVVKEKPWG